MEIQELKEKHSELYQQAKEEGRQEARQAVDVDAAKTEGRKEAQRAVLQAVESTFGSEARAKVQKAAELGLTPEQIQVLREVHAPAASTSDFEAKVNEHQQKHQCLRSKAIGAVAEQNPEIHQDWLRDQQNNSRQQILEGLQAAAAKGGAHNG